MKLPIAESRRKQGHGCGVGICWLSWLEPVAHQCPLLFEMVVCSGSIMDENKITIAIWDVPVLEIEQHNRES